MFRRKGLEEKLPNRESKSMPSLPVLVAVLLLGFPPFLKSADETFQEFIDRVLQAHNEAGDLNNKLQGITSPQDPRVGVNVDPRTPWAYRA